MGVCGRPQSLEPNQPHRARVPQRCRHSPNAVPSALEQPHHRTTTTSSSRLPRWASGLAASTSQPEQKAQLLTPAEHHALPPPPIRPSGIAVPRHMAFIMDGNYRWALARGRDWQQGHRRGVEALKRVVQYCCEDGVRALTVYAFSSENWQRDEREVSFILALLEQAITAELQQLQEQGVRLVFAGDRSELPKPLLAAMTRAEEATRANHKLVLCVALSYGGRQDIVSAARKLATEVQEGRLQPEQITADLLEQHLATQTVLQAVGPPDLLVRTSGEQRLSNFLLWELSYAELYFTGVNWPDFDQGDFDAALQHYAARQRRYGKR